MREAPGDAAYPRDAEAGSGMRIYSWFCPHGEVNGSWLLASSFSHEEKAWEIPPGTP